MCDASVILQPTRMQMVEPMRPRLGITPIEILIRQGPQQQLSLIEATGMRRCVERPQARMGGDIGARVMGDRRRPVVPNPVQPPGSMIASGKPAEGRQEVCMVISLQTTRNPETRPPKGRLTIQCDELWSVVGRKDNRQWIWLAIDERRAETVGLSVGARDRGGAEGLWCSLPVVYRQCAVSYTDFGSSHEEIFPASRHRAVGKETGSPRKIEHSNNTMRQRISRLVRKTLSCSKKLLNHIGAIWLCVHHYNASLGK